MEALIVPNGNSIEFPPGPAHCGMAHMLDFGDRFLGAAVLLLAAAWMTTTSACNVPVFRYALERWEADPYEITVFRRGPLTPEQQTVMNDLERVAGEGRANIIVAQANISGDLSQPLRALWAAQEKPVLPWFVMQYPRQSRIEPWAFAGPLGADIVAKLLDSPFRRDLTRKLLSGDAVVWLLLDGQDPHLNDDMARMLDSELRKLEQTLVLPERAAQDPPMNAGLPLKIAFSTLRLRRSDSAENMLRQLLLNWNTNLLEETDTMLFPVFGRGRVVSPAIGDQIQPEAIRDMAEFLTGPCSCEVKAMNPGHDLLLAANWASVFEGGEAVRAESPALVSLSQFALGATQGSVATSARATQTTPPRGDMQPYHKGVVTRMARNMTLVLGIGVVFVAAATIVFIARAGRWSR